MKITHCMRCMEQNKEQDGIGICPHCGFDESANPAKPHQLPYRTVLNGVYMVGAVIGEGGFGITYVGWDLNLGIKVAIKEFYPDGFVGREGAESYTVRSYQGDSTVFFNKGKDKFLEEARSLGKFMHLEGIVSVKDFFLENNTVYIVMEYLEGESLKSYARSKGGKIEPEELFRIIRPVLQSLMEIHECGIIHRDISPDNIMLCKNGKVKLIDFGAAREVSPKGEKSLSIMLKRGYSPEEQYRTHGDQGTWTDVYAMCATIYAMLTGIKPDEPLERMETETLQSFAKMGVNLNKRQENVLLKGLEIKASDRIQTIGDLYRGLYQDGKSNEFALKKRWKISTGKLLVLVATLVGLLFAGGGAAYYYYYCVPVQLSSVIWLEPQLGDTIAAKQMTEYLPKEATDVYFTKQIVEDGVEVTVSANEMQVTGFAGVPGTTAYEDGYILQLNYNGSDRREYVQEVRVRPVMPEISVKYDTYTMDIVEFNDMCSLDEDSQWSELMMGADDSFVENLSYSFRAAQIDFVELKNAEGYKWCDAEITSMDVDDMSMEISYYLDVSCGDNGEQTYRVSDSFTLQIYDLHEKEQELMMLCLGEEWESIATAKDEYAQQATSTLLDWVEASAVSGNLEARLTEGFASWIEELHQQYPETLYMDIYCGYQYMRDGVIDYSADTFYKELMAYDAIGEDLKEFVKYGLEARTIDAGALGKIVFWCLAFE